MSVGGDGRVYNGEGLGSKLWCGIGSKAASEEEREAEPTVVE